jgi:predicted dehydrogenase
MKKILIVPLIWAAVACAQPQDSPAPVRLAIVGLVHDHVRGILPELANRQDIQLVGVVEANPDVVTYYVDHFQLDRALVFPSIEALVAKTKVDAVAAFTNTFDHLKVVQACAPLGIDVMMEKPLAVSMEHARGIADAAAKGKIQIIVNYETTWYPSVQRAYAIIEKRHVIGDIRKIEVSDGHWGPKAIGCSPFFLEWLTDPALNGGGALMDFGCYGADLVTWLMAGKRPTSVLAVTQHFQPDVYPKVEDEATIVVTYPQAQAIIEASWNWPHGRKDMDIYGQYGSMRLPSRDSLFMQIADEPESKLPTPALTDPNTDSLSYLVAVVRGKIQPSGLSSLGVNIVVTEILDAARESAKTGKRVDLAAEPAQ